MPKIAETHIQNSAPGPPKWIAVATPAMLPTPTVAASAVDSATRFQRHTEPYWARFAAADIVDRRILDRRGAEVGRDAFQGMREKHRPITVTGRQLLLQLLHLARMRRDKFP